MADDATSVVAPAQPSITIDQSSQQPKPAAAAAPAQTPSDQENASPPWLKDRLDRERRTVLKELGVDDVDSAKKVLADYNAKVEAEKTAAEKAAELATKLKTTEANKATLTSIVAEYAESQMKGLSDEQKAAVVAIAGDDPAKQLKAITALAPTWKTSAPAATPAPAIKDTAPSQNAPADKASPAPTDHKAVHAELKKTNPILAARYAEQHEAEIYGI